MAMVSPLELESASATVELALTSQSHWVSALQLVLALELAVELASPMELRSRRCNC
jgi:hypothetical protein